MPVSVFCGKCGALTEKPACLADIVEISAGQELEYALTHAAENVEHAAEKWAAAL